MTVYVYLRLDNDSTVQKRSLTAMVTAYATAKGFGEVQPSLIFADTCGPLTPHRERPALSSVSNLLGSGDILLLSHFATLCSHATDAEAFLRRMNGKGVAVHVAEMGGDITPLLGTLSVFFKAFAHWESALICAERDLERERELHEETLTEYARRAVEVAVERLAKADLAGGLREAIKQSTMTASLVVAGKKKPSPLDIVSEEGKAFLAKKRPDILARLEASAEVGGV